MTHANCIGLGTKTFESLGVRLDATDRELNFHAGKTLVNSLKEKLRYDQATAISYQYGVIFEVDSSALISWEDIESFLFTD